MADKKVYPPVSPRNRLRIELDPSYLADLDEIRDWYLLPVTKVLLPDLSNAVKMKALEIRLTKEAIANKVNAKHK